MSYSWYLSTLDGDEYTAYTEILDGLLSLSGGIRVPKMEYKRISDIFAMVKLDRPEIFYVSGHSFRSPVGAGYTEVIPEYHFPVKKIPELQNAISSRADRILRQAVSLDEVKAVSFVSKWILENTVYEKLERQYSHEIYGVLSHGIGVCEGISKTVKYFLDKLGIDSLVVIGEANSENVRHAWNMISLHGKMRHYDLTFDLSRRTKGLKPIYSALTAEQIFKDHNKSVYEIPKE